MPGRPNQVRRERKRDFMAIPISLAAAATAALMLFWFLGHASQAASVELARHHPQDITPIHYVAITGTDSGDCSTPADACRTIQYAVDLAAAADEVRLAGGTYTDLSVRPRADVTSAGLVTQVVYISKTLAIKGGYATSDWLTPDPEAHPTTLDAGSLGRALYAVDGGNTITIEGLRFTGGDAAGLGGDFTGRDVGGGLYVYSATAIFSGVQVFGNTAEDLGGGLYAGYNAITFTGSAVYSNTAGYGGGLFLHFSQAALNANDVLSNTAGWGGGIYCRYCDGSTLGDNLIAANTADHFGGGVTLYDSQAALHDNVFTGNTGIGLYMYETEATLERETLTKNTDYGLELRWGSVATLVNTLVVDNVDNGLLIRGATAHLLHTTIARNGTKGLYLLQDGGFASVALTNTILVSHQLGLDVMAGSTVTLQATLWGTDVWANLSDWSGAGTILTGTVNVWGDPDFIAPDEGDYHIGSDSAARDAGVDAGVRGDIDRDSRPQGSSYDIGADEYRERYVIYAPLVLKRPVSLTSPELPGK
jgi:hypothetical protein